LAGQANVYAHAALFGLGAAIGFAWASTARLLPSFSAGMVAGMAAYGTLAASLGGTGVNARGGGHPLEQHHHICCEGSRPHGLRLLPSASPF
jgi:hypothetical protein